MIDYCGGLNKLMQDVNQHSATCTLASKTKIMEIDKWQENMNIQSFQCLGAMLTTRGDDASNIKQWLTMSVQALNNMQCQSKNASKEFKLKVLRACIFPIATRPYGCETRVGL